MEEEERVINPGDEDDEEKVPDFGFNLANAAGAFTFSADGIDGSDGVGIDPLPELPVDPDADDDTTTNNEPHDGQHTSCDLAFRSHFRHRLSSPLPPEAPAAPTIFPPHLPQYLPLPSVPHLEQIFAIRNQAAIAQTLDSSEVV